METFFFQNAKNRSLILANETEITRHSSEPDLVIQVLAVK